MKGFGRWLRLSTLTFLRCSEVLPLLLIRAVCKGAQGSLRVVAAALGLLRGHVPDGLSPGGSEGDRLVLRLVCTLHEGSLGSECARGRGPGAQACLVNESHFVVGGCVCVCAEET